MTANNRFYIKLGATEKFFFKFEKGAVYELLHFFFSLRNTSSRKFISLHGCLKGTEIHIEGNGELFSVRAWLNSFHMYNIKLYQIQTKITEKKINKYLPIILEILNYILIIYLKKYSRNTFETEPTVNFASSNTLSHPVKIFSCENETSFTKWMQRNQINVICPRKKLYFI